MCKEDRVKANCSASVFLQFVKRQGCAGAYCHSKAGNLHRTPTILVGVSQLAFGNNASSRDRHS